MSFSRFDTNGHGRRSFAYPPLVRNPIRLSATPIEYRTAPPTLGEHTDRVLGALLGMSADQIARLRGDRII